MPVELTFNAATVFELNEQVEAYVQSLQPTYKQALPPDPADAKYRSPLVEPPVNNEENPKPRRKHRRTKELVGGDIKSPGDDAGTLPEPQPEPLAEPQSEEPAEDDLIVSTPAASALDTVAAEKLKASVIAQMQEWFAAGKVKLIRGVLEQYGDGAKSFPEIPAERFAKIDQAIRSGALP